jgi:hypothetical protein
MHNNSHTCDQGRTEEKYNVSFIDKSTLSRGSSILFSTDVLLKGGFCSVVFGTVLTFNIKIFLLHVCTIYDIKC